MERDYGREIDELREAVQEIRAVLLPQAPSIPASADEVPSGHIQKMPGMHADPHIMAILDRLENKCNETGESGLISYVGVYESGQRQSTWIKDSVSTDELLGLIEGGAAERILACIGSADRLNLLLALLRKARTVTQLTGECGFTSTGQVYHHLKPLIAADLVEEDGYARGCYVVKPHRVQGILMVLAGIKDILDTVDQPHGVNVEK